MNRARYLPLPTIPPHPHYYYNCYIYSVSIYCPILLYMDIISLCMYVVYM